MQNNNSIYPQDWFKKAERDLNRVEILLEAGDAEGASIHLQQALEKYLKGYLISRGWKLQKIHDLEVLLNQTLSNNQEFEKYRLLCQRLTDYYTNERYPSMLDTGADIEEVKNELKEVKEFVHCIKK